MGLWSTRSRGIWHDSSKGVISAQALAGKDYLISKIGANFNTGDCNAAYTAKIPFGLFFEANPALYVQYPISDQTKWPTPDPTLKMLDSYIYMGDGTTKRAIHFIVIDCSATTDAYGHDYTTMWITTVGRYLIEGMKKKYKLPVYLYMNKNPFAAAKDEMSIQALSIFCTAYGDGLSTYTKATLATDGAPADGTKPVLPYDSGKPWGFWLYNANINGIDVIQSKDRTGFYSSISYTGAGNVTPPPIVPPVVPPAATVDLSPVLDALSEQDTKILALETKLQLMFDYLQTHIK
jgi:hypothetical protein